MSLHHPHASAPHSSSPRFGRRPGGPPYRGGARLGSRCWRRFREDALARWSAGLLLAILLVCLVGPSVATAVLGWTAERQDVTLGATPPSLAHPFGTDVLGRDLLLRTLCGGRVSLLLSLGAALLSLVIGVLVGSVSGYAGGNLDATVMRTVDILLAMPVLLLIIVLVVVIPPGALAVGPVDGTFVLMFLTLGLMGWLVLARIVRGQVLSLKEREFVVAARATGVPPFTILHRHVIPNTLGPIVVYGTFIVPRIVMGEAFLSFLGLGIQEPRASWGTLLRDGSNAMAVYPWLLVFPGGMICLTLVCMNLVGDGLRDALTSPGGSRDGRDR